MKTLNDDEVVIETFKRSGMQVFKVYGTLNNNPCFWTEKGTYRMDDKEDPRDIKDFEYVEN